MIFRYFAPSLFWTIFIVVMYSLPGNNLPSQKTFAFLHFDKIVHFITFAAYACMLNIGIVKQNASTYLYSRASWNTFVWCATLGSILELIQGTLFVDRTTEMADLLANLLGVVTGIAIFKFLYSQRNSG